MTNNAARKVLQEVWRNERTDYESVEVKEAIDRAIRSLEDRPQGKWKFSQGTTTHGSLKCSFCNYRDYHKTNSNFCPNCGADMQEVKKNDK